jgi:hypothetical protein
MIEEGEPFALTGVVVAEVLQGLIRDAPSIAHYPEQWDLLEPRRFKSYRGSSDLPSRAGKRNCPHHDRHSNRGYRFGTWHKRVHTRP